KEKRESTGSPKHAEAIALLDQRVRERKEEKLVENPNVTVRELLEDLVAHYAVRRLASARTVRTHLDAFCDLTRNKAGEIVAQGPNGIGHIRAAKLGAHVDGLLTRWQAADDAVGTINRRLSSLTQAYRLAAARRPPKVAHVAHLPETRRGAGPGRLLRPARLPRRPRPPPRRRPPRLLRMGVP